MSDPHMVVSELLTQARTIFLHFAPGQKRLPI